MAFQLQVTGSAGGFLLGLVEDPAMRPGDHGGGDPRDGMRGHAGTAGDGRGMRGKETLRNGWSLAEIKGVMTPF